MDTLMNMAANVVASYCTNNQVMVQDVPGLLRTVHSTLQALQDPVSVPHQAPAVRIGKSVTDTYIVCLEDGRRCKMLKRYLARKYKLSPDEYRKKWALPNDYPMVAPAYARLRSEFAKSIGLGKKSAGRPRKARKS